jgi:O-antigen ligase
MRAKKSVDIEISDLYALKFGKLWQALKQEHLSLWMLCIYFLFEYIRPQSLYPVIDILPWAQIFLFATIATAILDPTVRWVGNIENRLLIVFSLVVIISGIFAFRPAASLEYASLMATWIIVYFLTICIVNTEKRLILFLLAYCLFNFKMSQHGAVSWAQRGFSFASFGLVGSPGFFRNSGEYAIQMLIYGPLAISIILSFRDYMGRYKKWIFYLFAATGYMAVIGASSRGAQIALAVIAVWFLVKQKNGFKGLVVVVALAALLYYFLPEEQIQRFNEMGDDETSLQRLAYWKYGLESVIPKYPVLGVGYHNWLSYVYYMVPEGMGPYQIVEESHNIYIQAASELGFVGLFVFILLIIFAFVNNARTRKLAKLIDKPLLFNVSYGLEAGMIGFLVAGNFVTVLYYPFFWIQITMIVMVNSVANRIYRQRLESSPDTKRNRRRAKANAIMAQGDR